MNEGDAWFPAGVTRLLAETFVHGAEGGGRRGQSRPRGEGVALLPN